MSHVGTDKTTHPAVHPSNTSRGAHPPPEHSASRRKKTLILAPSPAPASPPTTAPPGPEVSRAVPSWVPWPPFWRLVPDSSLRERASGTGAAGHRGWRPPTLGRPRSPAASSRGPEQGSTGRAHPGASWGPLDRPRERPGGTARRGTRARRVRAALARRAAGQGAASARQRPHCPALWGSRRGLCTCRGHAAGWQAGHRSKHPWGDSQWAPRSSHCDASQRQEAQWGANLGRQLPMGVCVGPRSQRRLRGALVRQRLPLPLRGGASTSDKVDANLPQARGAPGPSQGRHRGCPPAHSGSRQGGTTRRGLPLLKVTPVALSVTTSHPCPR